MGKKVEREAVIHSKQTGVDYPQSSFNVAYAKRDDFRDYCTCADAPDCQCYVVRIQEKKK